MGHILSDERRESNECHRLPLVSGVDAISMSSGFVGMKPVTPGEESSVFLMKLPPGSNAAA
jgi:hypothetical protein